MYTIEAAYIFSIILLVIGSLVTSAIKPVSYTHLRAHET